MPPRPTGVRRTAAVVGAAIGLLAGLGVAPSAAARTVGEDGKPITNAKGVVFGVTAHRGGALERPENSVEAFRYSVAQGFDAIETDLLFTSDGHGVLAHYDTVPARCSHAGEELHLMTLEQVRQVRCEDLSGQQTVPIPTFEEFAAIVGPSELLITLDVKTYRGQPASGERRYAKRAVELLRKHKLLDRTTILSFRWATTLPTIRKLAPKLPVIGLDNKPLDLARVRLAAKLGADGFGIKAADTPVSLMRYIRSLGMDPVPWEVKGAELLAFSIHFGGKVRHLSTDTPAATRADLIGGRIELNPKPRTVRTALPTPVTVAKKATHRAKKRSYPKVMGVAVPADRLAMLETVTLSVKVTNGPGKGYLYAGAAGSPLKSNVRVRLPKGTKTLKLKAPVGDGGKIRLYASRKATLTVQAVEYTQLRFR